MAFPISIPRLGWSMEEAKFDSWAKNDGDAVTAGEPLFTLETDKALQEVDAIDSGTLRLLPNSPRGGDVVKVGQLIGYLLLGGEPLPEEDLPGATTVAPKPAPPQSEGVAPAAPRAIAGAPASTPRARRAAAKLGLELQNLTATGRGGRIRERDVLAAATDAACPSPVPKHKVNSGPIPITSLRRTIAERMTKSLKNTASVTLTARVDATQLVALRNQFKRTENLFPTVPTYSDIVAKLAAEAILRFPLIAGRWQAENIALPDVINIGIAVDTEYGLLVPVLRDVPGLPLNELAKLSRRLVDEARERRLNPEDLQGGVFTISNLGAYGIDAFTPIINYPETAILGLGAIRPAQTIGKTCDSTVGHEITLSLTFDHRVLDGAPAARFLQILGGAIEVPSAWLLHHSA